MIGRRAGGAALLATGVAALAVIPVASGSSSQVTAAAKKRTVKVRDYYFSPAHLKVPRKTTIVFKWPALGNGGDSHDVKLTKRPKGVKRWQSEIASEDYTFKRKLRKKGKYVVICSIHTYMRTTIRVK